MVRVTVVIAMVLLLAAAGAGLAPPAGAFVTPNLSPDPVDVFTRAGAGDVTGVAVGAGGGRYVCGYETFATRGTDISVRRVGTTSWTRFWDGAAHLDDVGKDVATSPSGAVYVVGSSRMTSGSVCTVLLKYSPTGKRLWVRRRVAAAGSSLMPYHLAVDGDGRIVVVGRAKTTTGSPHVFAARFRPDGRRLWLRKFPTGYLSIVNDLVVDSTGAIYIAGEYMGTDTASHDGLILKYSSGGTFRWAKIYGSAFNRFDTFLAACRRPAGGVYLAGSSSTAGDDTDGIVMQATAGGALSTIKRLSGGGGPAYWHLYDIALAHGGGVIVCGDREVTAAQYNFYVARFRTTGVEVWSHLCDSGFGYDRAELLAVGSDGGVAASGLFASGGGNYQVATYFFTPDDGVATHRNLWAGLLDGRPVAQGIAVRGTTVWVAGQTSSMTEGDGFLLRYRP